jgi:hypothetical protein
MQQCLLCARMLLAAALVNPHVHSPAHPLLVLLLCLLPRQPRLLRLPPCV